jgi:endonuclease G
MRQVGLEALLGSSVDFLPFYFLEQGHKRGQAVSRIVVREPSSAGPEVLGQGTGFLIGPDVLLTNHHVLKDVEKARVSTAEFNYQKDYLGNDLMQDVWTLEPDGLFITSPFEELDFSLVRVAKKNGRVPGEVYDPIPLRASRSKIAIGEDVAVIQHPGGRRKEAVLRESKVTAMMDSFIWYSSDTLEGSSGSPVFNYNWDIVALHHRGVIQRDDSGNYLVRNGAYVFEANEGIRISAIVEYLRSDKVASTTRDLILPLLGN